jgi:hypothetical protein
MQTVKNHARFQPLHHFILMPIISVLLVMSVLHALNGESDLRTKWVFLLGAFGLFVVGILSRVNALKTQDRIIRLEMRQRYFELTGTSLSAKEKQLKMGQIIALRFAGDAELIPLIERTIAEKLSSKEIKLAVTDWQADYYRV